MMVGNSVDPMASDLAEYWVDRSVVVMDRRMVVLKAVYLAESSVLPSAETLVEDLVDYSVGYLAVPSGENLAEVKVACLVE